MTDESASPPWTPHRQIPHCVERRLPDAHQIVRRVDLNDQVAIELTQWPLRPDGTINEGRTVVSIALTPDHLAAIDRLRAA